MLRPPFWIALALAASSLLALAPQASAVCVRGTTVSLDDECTIWDCLPDVVACIPACIDDVPQVCGDCGVPGCGPCFDPDGGEQCLGDLPHPTDCPEAPVLDGCTPSVDIPVFGMVEDLWMDGWRAKEDAEAALCAASQPSGGWPLGLACPFDLEGEVPYPLP